MRLAGGAPDELLDTLMRDPEELGCIAKADPELIDQHRRSSRGGLVRVHPVALEPGASALAAPNLVPDASRKPDLLLEWGILGVVDPEAERFPNSPSRCGERAAVRVAAGDIGHPCDPRSALIPFEQQSVFTGRHATTSFRDRARGLVRSPSAYRGANPPRRELGRSSGIRRSAHAHATHERGRPRSPGRVASTGLACQSLVDLRQSMEICLGE
jgi:hypothetical protein